VATPAAERVGFAIAPADGTPIHYSVTEPAGADAATPTAVLCDGIGCDGYVWKYLRRMLRAGHRVIHFQYRGHGRTPMPRDPARVAIADLADDLAAVLDDCGVDRAVLLGHSMGVQVVLETYRRHRDRVAALVLMCGAPGLPLRTFKGSDMLERLLPVLRFAVERAPGLVNTFWRVVTPTKLSYNVAAWTEINRVLIEVEDFMPYLEGIARVKPSLFVAMLAEAGRHDASDLLPRIEVPVLIVAGGRDGFTPASRSRAMHDAIPGSELLLIERGSHTAPLESPHLVGETIADFLERRVK
jgi:pimeloyl-ACP methyl ester carboxylesterase